MIRFARFVMFIAAGVVLGAQSFAQVPGLGGPKSTSRTATAEHIQTFGDSRDRVHVTVVPGQTKAAPGSDVPIAIILDHQPGWHTHTNDPKVPKELGDPEDYIKTQIYAEVPAGSPLKPHTAFIQWPTPHTVKVGFAGTPVDYDVFEDQAIAYLPVSISADAPKGPAKLTIKPVFQTCDDKTCLQPTPEPPAKNEAPSQEWKDFGYEVTIEIVDPAAIANAPPLNQAEFGGFDPSVWSAIHSGKAPPQKVAFDLFGIISFKLDAASGIGMVLLLLVAAIGGFLLNLTPCVLPVVPLKIMSLSHSGGNRRRTLVLGASMFFGVIGFWMALALAIAFISGFTATNQLFQVPAFTISVGVVIAIMAIGMCGLFSIRLPQFVYMVNPSQESLHGSFLFGVMTAILSTPCTAPFMGAAAAWAATQKPAIVLLVFFAIGFGMGLPYFVLSAFPQLVKRMPRTGPASELIKQIMGLLMLAAAAFFVGVGVSGLLVRPPAPPSLMYIWVIVAFTVAAGGWLLVRTLQITRSTSKRIVFGGIGALFVILSVVGGRVFTDHGPINWVYYTPQRLADAKQAGQVVVMEFTAEWCLNCKALEKTVLRNPRVAAILAEKNVTPIKVDLTGNNAEGNDMLHAVQRLTIPLLVVFAPDGREVFKGDFYTVDQVLAAVHEAQGKQVASRIEK